MLFVDCNVQKPYRMKLFKILTALVLILLLMLAAFVAYIHFSGIPDYPKPIVPMMEIKCDSISTAEGARIASMICVNCHLGNDGKLSGGFMKDLDPAFGKAWVANITSDPEAGIGKRTVGELAYFLRTGVKANGYYAPPWMPKFHGLSDQDMQAVLCFLKSDHPWVAPSGQVHPTRQPSFLAKILAHFVMKPLEFPTDAVVSPDTSNRIAYGKYVLQNKVECYSCHSADFKKQDPLMPEKSLGYLGGGNTLIDLEGKKIYSANITMHPEYGIGKWTYDDFRKAVKEGKRPDGKSLRYPMAIYSTMMDYEIEAIWAYLKSVPVLDNPVDRTGL